MRAVKPSMATNLTTLSTDTTSSDSSSQDMWLIMASTSLVLTLMTLTTVVGNVFVIAAILLDRQLHKVANALILSLAVADLLVALLVMPLAAVYEIRGRWTFGQGLCQVWTMSDVLCCTASILHLLAIAMDRYWAVTQVSYIQQRNPRRVGSMILLVWLVSVVVSLAPLFGLQDADFEQRVTLDGVCLVSQDVTYQVLATLCTFYVPLVLILLLYWRIFLTARARLRRRLEQKAKLPQVPKIQRNNRRDTGTDHDTGTSPAPALRAVVSGLERSGEMRVQSSVVRHEEKLTNEESRIVKEALKSGNDKNNNGRSDNSETKNVYLSVHNNVYLRQSRSAHTLTSCTEGEGQSSQGEQLALRELGGSCVSHRGVQTEVEDCQQVSSLTTVTRSSSFLTRSTMRRQRARGSSKKVISLEAKREKKAAKTLAIVTGAFIACWLPFFILALVMAIFKHWAFDGRLVSFSLWLGYFNSTLNPIIYTVFSPEFREAFRRLLRIPCNNTN